MHIKKQFSLEWLARALDSKLTEFMAGPTKELEKVLTYLVGQSVSFFGNGGFPSAQIEILSLSLKEDKFTDFQIYQKII